MISGSNTYTTTINTRIKNTQIDNFTSVISVLNPDSNTSIAIASSPVVIFSQ